MARTARIVLPGAPHHVTQRGNRRQRTFFLEEDYEVYLGFLWEWCRRHGVAIDAYCLMPNHVHLILVPSSLGGLAAAMSEIHRRYAQRINERNGWQGRLWQGRFFSVPLDEPYYENAMQYVELNPVRAGLVETPESYRWSSAYRSSRERPEMLGADLLKLLRKMTVTGRPAGSEVFYQRIVEQCGIDPRRRRPGPKRAESRLGEDK